MGEYLLHKASSGDFTLIYKNSKEIRIHSAYNPLIEAERVVSGFNKGRSSFIAVSGAGLGFHINLLKKKFPDTPLLVIEHDKQVVDLAVKTYPDHMKGIIIINSHDDISKIFEQLDISTFRGVSHYLHRPSYLMYKDFYDDIFKDISQYITSKISDLLTRFEFEEKWIENILNNIHHMHASNRVINFFGKFKGYPGIIVSAGPSLRKNVDYLPYLKNRSLILCVDTAIKVLHKKNISPHIIMTLDAQKYSIKHFLGLKNHNSILLADLVCCPQVLRMYEGKKIISTTSKYFSDFNGELKRETTPLMDWIEKFVQPIGDIQSGGSVATSAFDFLYNLGCDPIILIGQDLAYTGREIHCSGTHHNDDWLAQTTRMLNLDTINQKVIRKRKIKYVEAFGGIDKVISDFVFDLYKSWFEDSAKKIPAKVINSTEGGARIKNTEEKSLESIAKNFPDHQQTPEDILNKILSKNSNDDTLKLKTAVQNAIEEINNIKSSAQDMLNNKKNPKELFDLIDNRDIRMIFNPYLKKSKLFIQRHNVNPEKIPDMLLRDIISASKKIVPVLIKCSNNLNK